MQWFCLSNTVIQTPLVRLVGMVFRAIAIFPVGLLPMLNAAAIASPLPTNIPTNTICRPQGHMGNIKRMIVTADGRKLITAGDDWTIRVWNRATRQEERVLAGHRDTVDHLVLSADGKHLISGSQDGTIRLWNWGTGQMLHELRYPAHPRGFSSRPMVVLDQRTLEQQPDEFEPARIEAIAIHPQGDRLIGSDGFGNLKAWDTKTGKALDRLQGFNPSLFQDRLVMGLQFSPDGLSLWVASLQHQNNSNQVVVVSQWDLATGKRLATLPGVDAKRYPGTITWEIPSPGGIREGRMITGIMAFSPDARYAAIESDRGSLMIQDLQTGKIQRLSQEDHGSLAGFTLDGRTLLTVDHSNIFRAWDLATLSLHKKVQVPDSNSSLTQQFSSSAWFNVEQPFTIAPDGQEVIYELYRLRGISSRNLSTGRSQEYSIVPWKRIQAIQISNNGQTISALVGDRIQTAQSGTNYSLLRPLPRTLPRLPPKSEFGQESAISWQLGEQAFALTADGRTLITSHEDGTARIWDIATGSQQAQLGFPRKEDGFSQPIALTPDGKILIKGAMVVSKDPSRNQEQTLEAWEIASRKRLWSSPWGKFSTYKKIVMTEDGKRMLTLGKYEGEIIEWDVQTGEPTQSIKAEAVWDAIALSPDQRWIISGQGALGSKYIGEIIQWDRQTGKRLHSFKISAAQVRQIQALALLPDQKTLVIAFRDRWVELWDLLTGKLLRRLDTQDHFYSTKYDIVIRQDLTSIVERSPQWQAVLDIVVGANGKILYTASSDGTIKQWNLQTGEFQLIWCPR